MSVTPDSAALFGRTGSFSVPIWCTGFTVFFSFFLNGYRGYFEAKFSRFRRYKLLDRVDLEYIVYPVWELDYRIGCPALVTLKHR